MTPLFLHNSITNNKDEFVPVVEGKPTMYVCGPTVYDYAHIGNARPAIVFDVLYRFLRYKYGAKNVTYARNITDIDDKIMRRAEREGVSLTEISDRYYEAYSKDMGRLNVLQPDLEPRATQHIREIVEMIYILVRKGYAYLSHQHVLYDSTKRGNLPSFMKGAQETVGDVPEYKRNGKDFVLWKPSTKDQPGWHTPFGFGRPGWHIECSAMINKAFGKTVDIHGGGRDLKFPHHENEIAQSSALHDGAPLANYWVHNGFVQLVMDNISKSKGNAPNLDLLLKTIPGEIVRYAMMNTHYRNNIDWDGVNWDEYTTIMNRFYNMFAFVEHEFDIVKDEIELTELPKKVLEALNDDLNVRKVLQWMNDQYSLIAMSYSDKEMLRTMLAEFLTVGNTIGLMTKSVEEWFQPLDKVKIDGIAISEKIEERNRAKIEKNYAKADAIRDTLRRDGIILEDNPHGTTWRTDRG